MKIIGRSGAKLGDHTQVEHTALFEQTLDVAAPAYGRVCAAVLDLWFTAALDALPTLSLIHI